MRLRIALAAAVLLAPPLVHAQRASLSDRVAALESRAAGDQSGALLVNQITALQAEVQRLRGQLEELQQAQAKAAESQRAQYLDLSGRLDRLEGGTPPASAAAPPMEPPKAAVPAASGKATTPSAPAPTAAASGEQAAYGQAFEALKSGDYVESARRLREFLAAYPGSALASNALYWLGESYYVTQNYPLAEEQFRSLLDRFPTSDKAPGALLKLGLAQLGQRQDTAAAATLREVGQRYPGTDVARIAGDRLRTLQLVGNR